MKRIGFIGLGVMGAPMAGHLLDGSYELTTGVHRSPAPDWLIDKGLKVCSNPMEIAACSDVVITMVPNTPEVEQVLFGEGGTVLGIGGGKLVIDKTGWPCMTCWLMSEKQRLSIAADLLT